MADCGRIDRRGRSNFGRVGGNQSDYGCPRAGLRRESLSVLGGIREIGC